MACDLLDCLLCCIAHSPRKCGLEGLLCVMMPCRMMDKWIGRVQLPAESAPTHGFFLWFWMYHKPEFGFLGHTFGSPYLKPFLGSRSGIHLGTTGERLKSAKPGCPPKGYLASFPGSLGGSLGMRLRVIISCVFSWKGGYYFWKICCVRKQLANCKLDMALYKFVLMYLVALCWHWEQS